MRRASVLALCCSLVPAVPIAMFSSPAQAGGIDGALAFVRKPKRPKKPKVVVTPEQTAEKREPVQAEARALLDAGDPTGAGLVYDRGAAVQGDPVLYLDAGDAYLEAAKKDEDLDMAALAIERGRIAQDVLYFHLDPAADEDFRMVEAADVPGLLARADELIGDAEATVEALEGVGDPVGTTPSSEPKPKGTGKGKIIGGIALASVGAGLAVMGVAGLALGAANQNRAEDPATYGNTYDDVERRGKRANVLAGVGLGLGAACIAGGVLLYVLGKRDERRAAEDDKVVMVAPTLGGLAVTGRF